MSIIDVPFDYRLGIPKVPDEIKRRVRAGERITVRVQVGSGFVKNALEHGVAGLNIDGCRIGPGHAYGTGRDGEASADRRYTDQEATNFAATPGPRGGSSAGRWPANVIFSHHPDCKACGTKRVKGSASSRYGSDDGGNSLFDSGKRGNRKPTSVSVDDDGLEVVEKWDCHPDCPIFLLDDSVGNRPGCKSPSEAKPESKYRPGQGNYQPQGPIYPDDGGPSRFFYCAKASKSERTHKGQIENRHPTVKPIALMEYLCKLTRTPTGGLVLDPFCGSGSTGIAALRTGRKFIGIEKDSESCQLARKRLEIDVQKA